MGQEQFRQQVYALREEGKSIRAIARELGTYKTKVQRALKDLPEHRSSDAPAKNMIEGAFVGRQSEMDELRAALEDVVSGRARIVMLSGEPGIGKTRLAQESCRLPGQREVRRTRCSQTKDLPERRRCRPAHL